MAAIHVMMVILGMTVWHFTSVDGECCNIWKKYYPAGVTAAGHLQMARTNLYSSSYYRQLCPDCELANPYCGYGPCNIFACNCDGGCRRGSGICDCPDDDDDDDRKCWQRQSTRSKRAVSEVADVTADDIIKMADTDQDGRLSYEEARAYLGLEGNRTKRDVEFQELDLNGDGFFTANEIDRDG